MHNLIYIMKKNQRNFLQSVRLFLKKEWKDAIIHLISGQGFSYLLMHTVHNIEFLKHNNAIGITIMIALGMVPVLLGFLSFYLDNKSKVSNKLDQLGIALMRYKKNQTLEVDELIESRLNNDIVLINKIADAPPTNFEKASYIKMQQQITKIERTLSKTLHKKNRLLRESVISTLETEIDVIGKISSNKFIIPVLQHFDYLREVLGRVIKDVMKQDDHYITLASIDFWTLKPFDPIEFLKVNLEEVIENGKVIHRVMVIDPKFLTGNNLTEEELLKFRDFTGLIEKLKKFEEIDNSYLSPIKIIFYFPQNFDMLKEFLDSILVITKCATELMFIKVQKLAHINKEKPNVEIKFFEFPHGPQVSIEKHDIIGLLKNIKEKVKATQRDDHSPEENKALTDLSKYVAEFNRCFTRLSGIYNVSVGTVNDSVDLNKCTEFNITMMAEHYQKLRKQKPELFNSDGEQLKYA